jgi:hypothetical protein
MYNQIWSPLKQEFVPTLSLDGRQALKMYVNSFMTGGATSVREFILQLQERVGTFEKTNPKSNTVAKTIKMFLEVNINEDATRYKQIKNDDGLVQIEYNDLSNRLNVSDDILLALQKLSPHKFIEKLLETKQNKQQQHITQDTTSEADRDPVANPASTTTAPTREDSNENPKGGNTQELSEEQRKNIADEATNTAKAAEAFSKDLTEVGAKTFSDSVDNLKKAVNPE